MKHKRNIVSSALAVLLCLSLTLPALASYNYTVRKGDSLWKIAKTQMGSGNRWGEIYQANRDSISDPAKIYPGQILAIPADAADGAEAPADAELPTDAVDAASGAEEAADNADVAVEAEETAAAEEVPTAYQLESASSYDQVMKRHASISAQGVEYIGGEAKEFSLFGNDDMLYIGSEVYQRLVENGRLLLIEDGRLVVTLFVTEGDYQQAVNENKNYFMRCFGTEKWVETTVEEDAFSIVTEQDDAELVAQKLEAYGYDAAEGAIFVMSYRYDRDDLDLLDYSETVRYADGSERPLSKIAFAYDAGMELASSPFAEFFSGEPFQLTITSDPGAPLLEQTKTYTMSKCLFEVVCNGELAEHYYTDADCTQLYEGRGEDDYSDLHLYVKTHYAAPGEEQQELFRSAVEKNAIAELLSRHKSLSIESAVYHDGAMVVRESRYLDDQRAIYATDAGYCEYVEPAEGINFCHWENGMRGLVLEDDEAAVDAQYAFLRESFALKLLEGEELVYAKETDGVLCWISAAPEAAAREYSQAVAATYELPESGFQDGMTLLRCLYLDAETMEEISQAKYLVEADGTKHLSYEEFMENDYECRYENMPYAPFFEAEATCAVTVIFDPGTAEEVTVSASQPADLRFYVMYQGDYVDTLYTDPACTQEYVGGDGTPGGSVTLYYKSLPGGAEK